MYVCVCETASATPQPRNNYTYSIVFKILHFLVLKLWHSPDLCVHAARQEDNSPSAFYIWGIKTVSALVNTQFCHCWINNYYFNQANMDLWSHRAHTLSELLLKRKTMHVFDWRYTEKKKSYIFSKFCCTCQWSGAILHSTACYIQVSSWGGTWAEDKTIRIVLALKQTISTQVR